MLSSPALSGSTLHDPFRIGESYHVAPSLNRVTGPNGITRLEPKVMLVLVCLADHAGQLVPKERLMASVWADTAVGDDVLTRAISELRRLFEDDREAATRHRDDSEGRLSPDCAGHAIAGGRGPGASTGGGDGKQASARFALGTAACASPCSPARWSLSPAL